MMPEESNETPSTTESRERSDSSDSSATPPDEFSKVESTGRTVKQKRKTGRPKGYRKTGGRVKGTKNSSTLTIKDFSQKLFNRPTFQANLKDKWDNLTIDPSLARLFLQYGFGRPPEKIEVSGPDGGPIQTRVMFYLPKNGRETT